MDILQDLDSEQCWLVLKIQHFLGCLTTPFPPQSQVVPWKERTEVWEQLNRVVEDEAQLSAFELLLSALQLEIWRTLREWWHGEYHNTNFKDDIFQWRQVVESEDANPQHFALGRMGQRRYYWCMSGLFFQEIVSSPRSLSNQSNAESGFSNAWIEVRVSTIRKVSLAHASVQRLAQASYRWARDPSHLEENTRVSSINLEVCPWLESPRSSTDIPKYLWDIEAKKTVLAKDFKGRLDYICISHTWGRWRTSYFAEIKDVPWLVPKNTRFEVESWVGAELAAAACFGLFYLQNCGEEIPHIEEYLADTSRKSNGEVLPFHPLPFSNNNTVDPIPGWSSPLWTLQEATLCPHPSPANSSWNPLTHKGGIRLTLENMVSLIRTALEGSQSDEDAS